MRSIVWLFIVMLAISIEPVRASSEKNAFVTACLKGEAPNLKRIGGDPSAVCECIYYALSKSFTPDELAYAAAAMAGDLRTKALLEEKHGHFWMYNYERRRLEFMSRGECTR